MLDLVSLDRDSCEQANVTAYRTAVEGIRRLNLSSRGLTALGPDDFRWFSNVTHLNLSNNHLTTLPIGVFSHLTALTRIHLNGNRLTSLPANLFDHNPHLQRVNLYRNELEEVSRYLFRLNPALTHARLHNNPGETFELDVPSDVFLTGAVPYAADDHTALILFYALTGGVNWHTNTNWLTDKPINQWYGVDVGSDGRVTDLILNYNNLVGQIPAELSDLTALRHLELRGNKLHGELPDLSGMTELRWLDLAANWNAELAETDDSGTPRAESARLTLFTENGFCGPIPDWMEDLDKLQVLNLSRNNLTGAAPDVSLMDALDADSLHLDGNRLDTDDFGPQRVDAGTYLCVEEPQVIEEGSPEEGSTTE